MKFKTLSALLMLWVLVACSGNLNTPAAALPTVVLDNPGNSSPQTQSSGLTTGSGVTASGFVVPAQEAQMAFILGGNVKAVNVLVGDQVHAGKSMVELENAAIQMDVDQARRNLKELTSAAAIAAAEQAVASAQQTLKDTQDKADSMFYARASDALIKHTKGEIDLARKQLAMASDTYRPVARLPDGDTRKATALVAMTDAQLNLNALIAKYNWYTGTPTEIDAATARANLDAAKAALQEAQWFLSAIKGEQIPEQATGAKLAQLEQARDALAAAQQKLENTRLVAPISGVVVRMDLVAGEYASPGQIVVIVSDISRLHVETTDLSERDVPKIAVGQSVTVFMKALNENTTGHITAISALADTLGGDVVYKTTIELDAPPPQLRAGMSVDVQFDAGQ